MIKMFRLNSKHLEIWFQDESHWELQPESDQSTSAADESDH